MPAVDLKLYSIERFGYYSQKKSAPPINDMNELLGELKSWVGGMPLADNKICGDDSDTDENGNIYCFRIIKDSSTKDFLIGLWHEVNPGTKGIAAAIDSRATPSDNKDPDFESRKFGADFIPGYPSYFYFIPERKLFTPVRLDKSKNESRSLGFYLNGFLSSFSSKCHVTENERGEEVIDYYGESDSDSDKNYWPKFRYKTWQDASTLKKILDHSGKITKVLRREELSQVNPGQKGLMEFLLKIMRGQGASRALPTELKMSYELNYTPNKAQIKEMYDYYSNSMTDRDDLGFKIDDDILWFGHSLKKVSWDNAVIRRNNQGIYSAEGTFRFLLQNRTFILRNS